MATWSGWIQQFLSAANLPNTNANVTWLSEWAQHTDTTCRNNPIDLSRKQGSSTNCSRLTPSRMAQNYASHGQAASAFANQLNSGNFPALLAGLKAGDAFSMAKLPNVLGDLLTWGSTQWEKHLENEFGVTPGGGGIGGPGGNAGAAPQALGGWADLRRQVNQTIPSAVRQMRATQDAALRELRHGRRVRH